MAECELTASQQTTCSICMSPFVDPRILGCFHTFCTPCLVPIIRKWIGKSASSFPCPLCRKEIDIPENGVQGFQKNFYIPQHSVRSKGKDNKPRCFMCDNVKPLPYKCLECDGILCESCQLNHLRMKITKNHKIVKLKSSGQGIPCSIHEGNKMTLFCTFCKQKLCNKCKDDLHFGHDVEHISVAAERERQKLHEVGANVAEYMQVIESSIAPVKSEYKRMNKDLAKLQLEAHTHCEKLKENIDYSFSEFSKSLEQTKKERKSTVVQFAERVQNKQQYIGEILDTIETMKEDSDIDVLDNSRQLFRRLLTVVKDRPELLCEEYHFVRRDVPFQGKDSVGCLVSKSLPAISVVASRTVLYTPMFDVRLVSSFQRDNSGKTVTAIAPISENFAWVCYNKGKTIYLCSKEGAERKQITLSKRVENIAVCPDGSLLITSFNNNILWQVDKTYSDITREVSFDYHLTDLCCTNNGVYLILKKVVSFITNETTSTIIRLDSAVKNVEQCENKDDENKETFGALKSITEMSNGDLAVLEFQSKGNNYVELIVLSPTLQRKYKHVCVAVDDKMLKPSSMCIDVYGNIFLGEQNVVYLWNKSANKFCEFLTPDKGIHVPNKIAVDGSDHLWVGDSENGHIHIFKYMK